MTLAFVCTVCNLDAKPRKIGEELLKAGVSFRDVAEWAVWYRSKHGGTVTSKSAWGRHKVNGHFQMKERTVTMDGEVLDLDEFVDTMWASWQKANKGKVPATNELMKWIDLRSKIRGDLSRREEEKRMRQIIEGAAPNEDDDAVHAGRIEGNSGEDPGGPDAATGDGRAG